MGCDLVIQGRKYCTSVAEAVEQTRSDYEKVFFGIFDVFVGFYINVDYAQDTSPAQTSIMASNARGPITDRR
jgi:hypothetical protein